MDIENNTNTATSKVSPLVIKTNHIFKTYNEYKSAFDTFVSKVNENRIQTLKDVENAKDLSADEIVSKVIESVTDSFVLSSAYSIDLLTITNNFVLSVEDCLLIEEKLDEDVMNLYNNLKDYSSKTQFVVLKDGTFESKEKGRVEQIKVELKKVDLNALLKDLSNINL